METKERGRHRLGGKHSDPILVPTDRKKPSGRRAARPVDATVVPPVPAREPTVHTDAVDTVAAPPNTGMISVVRHKGKFSALAAIATGGLLIVSGGATAAHKPVPKNDRMSASSDLDMNIIDVQDPITVPIDVLMEQEKVEVKTYPKPAPPPPAPVVKKVAPPVVAAAKPAPAKVTVAPAAKPIVVEGRAAIIASAALGQLGVRQDCTRLVTNALAAAGIKHHGWPVSYYNIGRPIPAAEAIPGDLIYYVNGGTGLAHIAVYIGNGQAVHGGWNGNQTVVFSAKVGSGPQYIRV